jgi:hypothetical protein
VVLAAVFLSVPHHSEALPITYDFELLVTGFRFGENSLFSGIQTGDILAGSVTFDPATAHNGEAISFSGDPTFFQIDLLPIFDSTAFYVDHTFDYALSVIGNNTFFALHFALTSLGADPLQFPSDVSDPHNFFTASITDATGHRETMEGAPVSFSQVPEPTTLALTLTGAATAWFFRRSRRSRQRASKARKVS